MWALPMARKATGTSWHRRWMNKFSIFYHASEYVTQAADALFGSDQAQQRHAWLNMHCSLLKHDWAGARAILGERQVKLVNRLLDGFEGKLTSSKWAAIAKCSPDTALRDTNELMAHGMLRKSAAGGRSTSYELNELLAE
jgi:Fic family protein